MQINMFNKRGEIATIIAIGSIIVLGIITLASSSLLQNKRAISQKPKADDSITICKDDPVNVCSLPHPNGYYWKPNCATKCVLTDNDKKITYGSDDCAAKLGRNREQVWCYGYQPGTNDHETSYNGFRCLTLETGNVCGGGGSSSPTNTPTPTANASTPTPSPTPTTRPAEGGGSNTSPTATPTPVNTGGSNPGGGSNTGGNDGGPHNGSGTCVAGFNQADPNRTQCLGCSGHQYPVGAGICEKDSYGYYCINPKAAGDAQWQDVNCDIPRDGKCTQSTNYVGCGQPSKKQCILYAPDGVTSMGTYNDGEYFCNADNSRPVKCSNGSIVAATASTCGTGISCTIDSTKSKTDSAHATCGGSNPSTPTMCKDDRTAVSNASYKVDEGYCLNDKVGYVCRRADQAGSNQFDKIDCNTTKDPTHCATRTGYIGCDLDNPPPITATPVPGRYPDGTACKIGKDCFSTHCVDPNTGKEDNGGVCGYPFDIVSQTFSVSGGTECVSGFNKSDACLLFIMLSNGFLTQNNRDGLYPQVCFDAAARDCEDILDIKRVKTGNTDPLNNQFIYTIRYKLLQNKSVVAIKQRDGNRKAGINLGTPTTGGSSGTGPQACTEYSSQLDITGFKTGPCLSDDSKCVMFDILSQYANDLKVCFGDLNNCIDVDHAKSTRIKQPSFFTEDKYDFHIEWHPDLYKNQCFGTYFISESLGKGIEISKIHP